MAERSFLCYFLCLTTWHNTETETDPSAQLGSITCILMTRMVDLHTSINRERASQHFVLIWAVSTVMSFVLIARITVNFHCILQLLLPRPSFYSSVSGLSEAGRCTCISDPVVYKTSVWCTSS